ncbi:MAG: M1 family aminopeptidase [Candidatus Acidiferrales bacterium]
MFRKTRLVNGVWRPAAALLLFLLAAHIAPAQTSRAFPFRATNYNVEVIVFPNQKTISAEATVDFVANKVSRTVLVELHPDLRVASVKTASGQSLSFDRDGESPLLLSVELPSSATPGDKVSLTFEYSGSVSSQDDSPTKGVRFASVDKTSAYLLLPARWFPLTNYPSNRYTGTFDIIVPSSFAVVGTGKAEVPTMRPGIGPNAPEQASYVFHCDQPSPAGSFVAGSLQLSPVAAQGYHFSIYTPAPQASTAMDYGSTLALVMSDLSDEFGGLAGNGPGAPSLTVAQMPDGSLDGFSAPGLLLVSARQWTTKPNGSLLAQLAAGQWWGDSVLPASAADVWLTNGLSRYASAIYAEQADGISGLHRELSEFAIGALMYDDAGPISQAQRMDAYSDQFDSVVENKGAMVFHMLRTEMGDDAFTSLLHDFYSHHAGKTASIDEFEQLAAQKLPPPKPNEPTVNLVAFFSQWLNSTGIPEFKLNYIVYRTAKGFKVVGKILQPLDTFRMPVDVRVETEGNPVDKKILVDGTSTEFEVDTFGRPTPDGISIDPNNNLLKSTPQLRVRAIVARGESYASAGKYYEAVQEYQQALEIKPDYSLAHFREGEAMFYQKNYQAAANAFRSALGGDLDPKWTAVWSHIYIGKIYDLLGQRERAVNEYSLAEHTHDDTAGAQAEAAIYIKAPYKGDNVAPPTSTGKASVPATSAAKSNTPQGNEPVLKRRTDDN